MATVTVRASGQAAVVTHKRATLVCGSERLMLAITSPEVTHTNLTTDWQQVGRPGQRPLLRAAGQQLRQMTFDVTLYWKGRSMEKDLQTLRRFAGSGKPIAVSYGATDSGMFALTDLQIRSVQREFGTNNITHASATLTFTEVFPDGYTLPTAAKPAATAHPKPSTSKPKAKTYTVRKGDTLSRIALAEYGDANKWPTVAKANKLKDPNKIAVGQKLVIP